MAKDVSSLDLPQTKLATEEKIKDQFTGSHKQGDTALQESATSAF
jgi:hypothetical protein